MINDYTKEQLEKLVPKCTSISDCLRKMGYSPTGDNHKKLSALMKKYEIDTSNFKLGKNKRKSNKEIFRKGSVVVQSTLRTRFHDVCDKYECDVCGLKPEWNGKPLTLVLDHIDGDHTNNEISNLHWVCPNCNSQLTTTGYKGYKKYDEYGNRIVEDRIPIEDNHEKNNRQKIRCPKCGRLMTKQAAMCKKCTDREKRERSKNGLPVSRDELKELIRTKSFTDIGKQYNLSDNAIRKWCKKYSLPFSKNEIKSYTDSQWEKL